MTKSKTRIFLVDDHPIVRRGLQLLISLEPDMMVCGDAESAPVALEKILLAKPDLVVVDLAATSGIHRASDVLKILMAGADVTMLCSTLIRHGARQIGVIERDMVAWMEEHEYTPVAQMKGSLSQKNCDIGVKKR